MDILIHIHTYTQIICFTLDGSVPSPSKRNGSGPSPLMVSDGTCAQSDGTGFQSVGACVLSDVVPHAYRFLDLCVYVNVHWYKIGRAHV